MTFHDVIAETLTGGTEEKRKEVAGVLVEAEVFSRAGLANALRIHDHIDLGRGSIEQAVGILENGRGSSAASVCPFYESCGLVCF